MSYVCRVETLITGHGSSTNYDQLAGPVQIAQSHTIALNKQ